jgi:predicted dehydrogenase
MRFALVGDDFDGIEIARAFAATGRHELGLVHSVRPNLLNEILSIGVPGVSRPVKHVADVEEILADPEIEIVIVASAPTARAEHLRRALQSERHVICVHPVESSPEAAYEATMIQRDTDKVLFPILTEFLHPAIEKMADIIRAQEPRIGELQIITCERRAPTFMLGVSRNGQPLPILPGWDVLRELGGDIAEVVGFAEHEDVGPSDSIFVSGRFERGRAFQLSFVPKHPIPSLMWTLIGTEGRCELRVERGWRGAATLAVRSGDQLNTVGTWDYWEAGPVLVRAFEAAVAAVNDDDDHAANAIRPTWQDAIRCLELEDAARRSIAKRRGSSMEYQETTEEVGFKGTMTLVGCGLLWGIILLVVLSRWYPWLGWGIIPLLAMFLVMQTLRWVLPRKRNAKIRSEPRP